MNFFGLIFNVIGIIIVQYVTVCQYGVRINMRRVYMWIVPNEFIWFMGIFKREYGSQGNDYNFDCKVIWSPQL